MSEWRQLAIGQIGRVVTGKTPPTGQKNLFGGEYPFITPTDIQEGQSFVVTERFLSEDGKSFQHSLMLPQGTVCFVCIGATIGKMCITSRPSFTNQQVNSVVVNPKEHDPDFVFHLLRFHALGIKAQAGGAATPIINKTAFSNIEVRVPTLDIQKQIGAILSAYDDLIENNTRRIKILEEMAQMIYREWFVNFRFPGHEKVRMVESELGPIPEGWTAQSVTESVFVNPTTRVPKEGLKPFLPMGSLADHSMLINKVEEREGNSGAKFRNGDTLFARITPCLENGKTGFVQFLPADEAVAFGSTEFIVLRSKTICPEYVYLMARSSEFRDNAIKSMFGASGRQRVQEACFNRFIIAQPDTDILLRFHETVSPMFRLIQSLSLKNNNLRTTRDLLLPKLISGEIPVESDDEAAAETTEEVALHA